MTAFEPDGPPGPFTLHCRWGSLRLETNELDDVIAFGRTYAERNGLCVLISDALGNDLVFIAPAPQCDDIPAILFDGLAGRPGLVALN